MSRPVLLHSDTLLSYSFGPDHPMGPDRVRLALELADYLGIMELFDICVPLPQHRAQVRRIHDPDYLEALGQLVPHPRYGWGTEDNPLAAGIHEVALDIAAASTTAAQLVWEGQCTRAVNIAGGLHHAQRNGISGFCMLNDAASAIDWLLEHGAQRVAYLDVDAHHGDGVEQMFWDDPRVLTISVHESGLYLFPGTGFAGDIGGPQALGTAVNVALEKNISDQEWLRAVHGIIPPLLQRFRPQIIISQHGADPHRADPLTHMELSVNAMEMTARSVRRWADRYAQGRWVALGGGGYQRDSVARTWASLLAAVAGVVIDMATPMPAGWDSVVHRHGVVPTSTTLGDSWADLSGIDPTEVIGGQRCQAMVATSKAVFPYWGIAAYHG
ncbi:Acetoin utilization protein AcuC [Corynebacterium ciconiae DSM 44920]|uniref:acetoin utilization protein AcuC n=1 Tax=Corynebacterium ciconiae TaxID=227319 RepID=UPI00035EF4E0|nr:acetoin utilization protein AcuC [Corynebacterium ciconiae]WKD60301.1 Acetoin utilization protein AcuC [Corynebacterium ciconiae DSM 44920]